MSYDPHLWQKLSLGDRVLIIHWPEEFDGSDFLHDETAAAYQWLIETAHILTVSQLEFCDDERYPWSDEFVIKQGGADEHHCLMLNHSGLELVK